MRWRTMSRWKARSRAERGNSKSEYRNPKRSSKAVKTLKTDRGPATGALRFLDFHSFGFVSDFDIRISDFRP